MRGQHPADAAGALVLWLHCPGEVGTVGELLAEAQDWTLDYLDDEALEDLAD